MSQTKKSPISMDAIQRIQAAEARKHGGGVPKDSHVGRMQAKLAKKQASFPTSEAIATRATTSPDPKPVSKLPRQSRTKPIKTAIKNR